MNIVMRKTADEQWKWFIEPTPCCPLEQCEGPFDGHEQATAVVFCRLNPDVLKRFTGGENLSRSMAKRVAVQMGVQK